MGILHISTFDRALLPALAAAVLSVAAFSAGTQGKPNSPVITVDAPAPAVEPRPSLLQFASSDNKVSVISEAQPKRRRKGRKSMSRRSGQNGTVVIQSGWYRVRWRMDVEGQKERSYMSEQIAPVVLDKNRNPKPPSQGIRRTAREIVERSGANSEQRFNRVVLGETTFREQV